MKANEDNLRTTALAGISFHVATASQAAETVISSANSDFAQHIHLVNAFTISLAAKDHKYMTLLNSGITFPDGKPIQWFSRILKQPNRLVQVRGPQLFLDVLEQTQRSNITHFFLGGTNETLEKLVAVVEQFYPSTVIAGTYSPPFRELSDKDFKKVDEAIQQSSANLVWVGLGTPKQDFEVARIAASIGITSIAIGAAFGFTAGTIPKSPQWMEKIGLEWLFRLLSEPKRLWRRYLFGNLQFISAVIKLPRTKRSSWGMQ